jgi:acyl-CoA synthetase (AMP-forming)/AMP-acid ligase II
MGPGIAKLDWPMTTMASSVVTATKPTASSNIASMLWDAAARAGDRTAVIERAGITDYVSLRDRAVGVHGALRGIGIKPDERVAILLERGADAIAAYFGVVAAGAIAVVINEKLRPRQIEHMLDSSGATLLISSADMLARQPRALETRATIADIATMPVERSASQSTPLPRIGADFAQIIYTSGSTGLPKGVVVTHDNLWSAIRTVATYLAISSTDRIASLLPLNSVYGMNQLLCSVLSAASLVIEVSPLPNEIDATLRAREVTVLAAVPPLWLQLLGLPRFRSEPIPSLRVLQNAGGHLPTSAVRQLRAAHPHALLFLQYGLTEALRSAYLSPDEVDQRPGSIGKAIAGAEILLLREDLTPCAVGEVGEIVQRGPTVTAGYWGNSESTARVFRPNPLRPAGAPDAERVVFTGDLARRDAEGFLHYVGRRDRMIKTLGHRVGPDEIVEVLHASGEIVEALIDAEEDEERGMRIVAYVVLATDGSVERLKGFCRRELPRHMQPSRIETRSALARTASGKHDVNAERAKHAYA